MSNNESRLGATFFMWTAVTIITIALLVTGQFSFIFGAFLAGAAMFGTMAVWNAKFDSSGDEAAEKAKRSSRVEKFVSRLDERELEELRVRLLADHDGETVSLDDLLNEVETRRGR